MGGTARLRQKLTWLSLVVGGGSIACGLFLPWGRAREVFVTGLSSEMTNFTLALLVVVLLSLGVGVLTLRGLGKSMWTKALAATSAVFATAMCLLLPAGVSLGTSLQAGVPSTGTNEVSFQFGTWLVAAGLVLVLTGVALLLTSHRLATLVTIVIMPITLSALLVVELR